MKKPQSILIAFFILILVLGMGTEDTFSSVLAFIGMIYCFISIGRSDNDF